MKKPLLLVLALVVIVAAIVIFCGRFTEKAPETNPAKDATLEQLKQFIVESPNEISMAYYDFTANRLQEINGNKILFPASMIKTLFLLTALEAVENGELSMEATYTLKEVDKFMNDNPVTGSGTMQAEEPGKKFTVEEILHLMISVSDNIAANITFDLVGSDKITNLASRMGLYNTSAQQKMFQPANGVARNTSTAVDLTKMLIALENATVVNEELSHKGIAMMKDTVDKNRIGRNEGETITVANKIGTAGSMIGDMALLYFPNRPPIALTIMVKDPEDREQADDEIGKLTKILVDSIQD